MNMIEELMEINSFLMALGLGGVVSVAVKIYKMIRKSREETERRFKNLECANLAMLHDKIYGLCSGFIEQGWVSIDDLENLDYLWRGYSGLGGNGTGETLYKKVKELPNKQGEQ